MSDTESSPNVDVLAKYFEEQRRFFLKFSNSLKPLSEEQKRELNQILFSTEEDLTRWFSPSEISRMGELGFSPKHTQMDIDPSLWFGSRPMLFVLLPKKVLEELFWLFLLKFLLELPLPPFDE